MVYGWEEWSGVAVYIAETLGRLTDMLPLWRYRVLPQKGLNVADKAADGAETSCWAELSAVQPRLAGPRSGPAALSVFGLRIGPRRGWPGRDCHRAAYWAETAVGLNIRACFFKMQEKKEKRASIQWEQRCKLSFYVDF
ncbi:hypothetical protein AAHA92_33225 [Salvia divinorum]|uniref:Uncharacterized protein n=1 Tax=Salvia divinorum TaxID=28513 RepID=A0ABD1FNV7_SALDI